MHTKSPSTPYLQRIGTKPGFYFVRAVPRDLQQKIGKKHWRWKAGNDLSEARRAIPEFLTITDQEIAEHRGDVAALMDVVARVPRSTKPISKALEEQGLSPQDIYPRISEEDAHRLVERQSRTEQGLPVERHWEELLKLATRLKDPAPSTAREWRRYLSKVMELSKTDEICSITEGDARAYRDHLLDSVAPSTAKTRLRYVKSLFDVAEEEDWIERNPFTVINLKRIKSKATPKKPVMLDEADKLVSKLPEYQQTLYWILRFTGCHVSEGAGLKAEDIDLQNNLIHIRENDLRPLKNPYRIRELPIVDRLREELQKITITKGHLFPGLYDKDYSRWGNGMAWHRRIGVSPKACRDAAATVMRDNGVNEFVIGSILGHTPKTSTNMYGSVTLEAKREALQLLESG